MELKISPRLSLQRTSQEVANVHPCFGDWPGASEGVASVSFDLPKRDHSLLPSSPSSVGAVWVTIGPTVYLAG
jgi:hypothetical protein